MAFFFFSCVGHAVSGIFLHKKFCVHLPETPLGPNHGHLEKMLQLLKVCASSAAVLHFPLFFNQKLRLVIFACILSSLAFLMVEAMAVTYIRSNLDLLIELYKSDWNSTTRYHEGAFVSHIHQKRSVCCATWKAMQSPLVAGFFPKHWAPRQCCGVFHQADFVAECLKSKNALQNFEDYSCLQKRLGDIYATVTGSTWLLLGLLLSGFITFEVFLYILLRMYRISKWG
uniref:Tetraspanin n=1 Tax=Mesocestoides corti TaxID=53468 RepID=A0A5K3FX39_MESCO